MPSPWERFGRDRRVGIRIVINGEALTPTFLIALSRDLHLKRGGHRLALIGESTADDPQVPVPKSREVSHTLELCQSPSWIRNYRTYVLSVRLREEVGGHGLGFPLMLCNSLGYDLAVALDVSQAVQVFRKALPGPHHRTRCVEILNSEDQRMARDMLLFPITLLQLLVKRPGKPNGNVFLEVCVSVALCEFGRERRNPQRGRLDQQLAEWGRRSGSRVQNGRG